MFWPPQILIDDFNSQPREGGWFFRQSQYAPEIYFNSQPREGGWWVCSMGLLIPRQISTHSRAKAAGRFSRAKKSPAEAGFQLTAARRRLGLLQCSGRIGQNHFNSQPREGGWADKTHHR